MLQKLKQPYPLATFSEAMKRDLFFGLFLTVFLLVFTPFGLEVFAYERIHIIAGYGLVFTVTIVMNDVIGYHLFSGLFNEASWKVSHQITWAFLHLLILGMTNLAFGFAVGAFPITWLSFFKLELYVIACAIIPITLITLARQNYLLRKNSDGAETISQDIRERKLNTAANSSSSRIMFQAENNKDFFESDPHAILWIQSQDNYVEFAFVNEGKVRKELLRSTLGKVESTLSSYPNFFRCHRAFIVNLDKIKSVQGNSQGYRLQMDEDSGEIPVARSKNRSLKDLIHERAQS
ncbi:MAG: LytTR family transcriptional regulator [Bacteroidetes bacterium]|nr:LytTR family transcriptional regulator [Bacteroidota bacterium]